MVLLPGVVSENLIVVLAVLGLVPAVLVLFSLADFLGWIGKQIEARRAEPHRMVEAETKRLKAATELEEKTIRRLELEIAQPLAEDPARP